MLCTRGIAKPRSHRVLWLLPLLSLTLATLACGISLGSHIGYQPPPVTHLPAPQLRLAIQITSQYADYSATGNPNAYINIGVFDATNAEFSLPENAQIRCNGNAIARSSPTPGKNLSFSCPRQQPGGAYRIAYTDEHGATTTITVPVPTGTFAILSPRAGASVPIPTNGAFTVRYTLPTPPPNGSVAVDNVTVACNVSPPEPCGAVYGNLQPSAAPTPTFPEPSPAVVVTQQGDTGTVVLTGDYSQFRPAKGILSLSVEAHVTPDQGDFAAVSVIYSDMLQSYFTWTR